jgi:BirA family biotin operon repressor/biotin-[acetyl-CoA-carboxylase] ligase
LNNQINWSVVGIGININQEEFEDGINATSLKLESGKDHVVQDILKLLCIELEKYYLSMLNTKLSFIKERYLKHLFGLNQFLDFEVNGSQKTMLVKGLGDTGLLILEDKDGKNKEVDVKEVKWMY